MTERESMSPTLQAGRASDWLEPLSGKTVGFALAVLYVVGLYFAGSSQVFRAPSPHDWPSLLDFALLGVLVPSMRGHRPAAARVLVIGSSVLSFLAACWGGYGEALWLLLLPGVVATLADANLQLNRSGRLGNDLCH